MLRTANRSARRLSHSTSQLGQATRKKTMSHQRHKDLDAGSSKGSVGTTVADPDRRGGNRHCFTAAAGGGEVFSGVRFSPRTHGLGPGGCFVDTTNLFPVGSKLHVRLHKGKTSFETTGTVVYSQHGLGMGIAFSDLPQERRSALESWIAG